MGEDVAKEVRKRKVVERLQGEKATLHKESLKESAEDQKWVEIPICPYCGKLTIMNAYTTNQERLPCCGRKITEETYEEQTEWFRFMPLGYTDDEE